MGEQMEQVGWVSDGGLFYTDEQRNLYPAVHLRPVYAPTADSRASRRAGETDD